MYNGPLETVFAAFAKQRGGRKKNLLPSVDCTGRTWAM